MRHQKAVDPISGEVVGYARWVLPEGYCEKEEDGERVAEWKEAQVEDVSEEDRGRFEEMAREAWWEGRSDMDSLDDENNAVTKRITSEKAYISKSA